MAAYRAQLRSRDINGRAGKTNWLQRDNTSAAVGLAIDGLSCAAGLGSGWLERKTDSNRSATNAQYPSVRDKAFVEFASAVSTDIKTFVPAPKTAIFKSNLWELDLTNTDVLALAAAAVNALSDSTGGAVTTLVAGKRNMRKRKGV